MSISSAPVITLRPASDDELPFLSAVYADSRAEELQVVPWSAEQKADFLRMQFEAQHKYYHMQYPDADYDLVLRDGTPIGRLYVDRAPNEIRVMDIALLADYRGHGIGTSLIRAIMDEASAAGVPVSLHVETFNRARRLYDRLGFIEQDTNGIYALMEWTPETKS